MTIIRGGKVEQMGKKKHSIDIIFMFVLFTIFAILSVLIIVIGSGVYEKISNNKALNEQSRTTLSYVVNKVRGAENEYCIHIDEAEGREVLVIDEEIEGIKMSTLLFVNNGKLKEATIMTGDEYTLDFGDIVIDVNDFYFEIDEEDNLLTVGIIDKEGYESKTSIYLKKVGGR